MTDKDIIYKLLIIIVVFAGITLVGTYLINLADSKITKQLDYLDQKVIKIID